jgi:hypothetical protein
MGNLSSIPIGYASKRSAWAVRATLALSVVAACGAATGLGSCSSPAAELPCPSHAPIGVEQRDCNKQQFDSCMYLDPCNRELLCLCPRDHIGWQCQYAPTSCGSCKASDYLRCLTGETTFERGGDVPVDWRPGGPPSFGDGGAD